MINYGSAFHKAVGVLALPTSAANAPDQVSLTMEYWSAERCVLVLAAHEGGRVIDLRELSTSPGAWRTHTVSFNRTGSMPVRENMVVDAVGVEGSGDIVITRFAMIDAHGAEIHTVEHGAPVSFRTHFEIRRTDLRERAEVFIVVSRNSTERVCKFKTNELLFDGTLQPTGIVAMHLPKMMLGQGTYTVAVEIAAEGYLDQAHQKFFSIDPNVYCCLTHALEFVVLDSGWIGPGTILEGEGEWMMSGSEAG
jgi:hypothetical protein